MFDFRGCKYRLMVLITGGVHEGKYTKLTIEDDFKYMEFLKQIKNDNKGDSIDYVLNCETNDYMFVNSGNIDKVIKELENKLKLNKKIVDDFRYF